MNNKPEINLVCKSNYDKQIKEIKELIKSPLQPDWNETDTTKQSFIRSKPDFENQIKELREQYLELKDEIEQLKNGVIVKSDDNDDTVEYITDIDEIEDFISRSSNKGTIDDPIKLKFRLSGYLDLGIFSQILLIVANNEKYVELDLQECTTESDTWFSIRPLGTAGKDKVISLTFPDSITILSNINNDLSNLKEIIGQNATSVSNYAIQNCTSLTSIDLPNVTDIGYYAFISCTALTSLHIPNVTSIGSRAFAGCSSITSIDLPNVTSINGYAFESCTSLISVNLPNVTSIDGLNFRFCTSLKSVNLPNVESIGQKDFYDCSSLKSINIPKVTSIGNSAFYNCTSLTSIDLPNLEYVSNYTFYGCSSLTSINIPNVTNISDKAFTNCTSLRSIDLPNCQNIGHYIFEGCTSLTSVNLPSMGDSMYLGDNTFEKCTSLTSIKLGINVPVVGSNIFNDINSPQTITVKLPTGATGYGSQPTNTTDNNWGNAFRGKGWNGEDYQDGIVNDNITLKYEYV